MTERKLRRLRRGLSAPGPDCSRQLRRSLKSQSGLSGVPSGAVMRERPGRIDPQSLRPVFKAVSAGFQRGGGLEKPRWSPGGCLAATDGTGFFSSKTVRCGSCCVRGRRGGAAGCSHRMAAACLVSPLAGAAPPLMPEMVTRGDGRARNGCGTNAARRMLRHIRRGHPHPDMTVLMDGLHSKATQVRLPHEPGMSCVIGAKPGDHGVLCGQPGVGGEEPVIRKDDGRTLTFRRRSGEELNGSGRGLRANVLHCGERAPERRIRRGGGKTRTGPESVRRICRITGHEISPGNPGTVMEAGRCRRQAENGLFRTLKCQGYGPANSCGHGKRHPARCPAAVMMPVFTTVRIQEICRAAFRAVMALASPKAPLWRIMCAALDFADLPGRESLFQTLTGGRGPGPQAPA